MVTKFTEEVQSLFHYINKTLLNKYESSKITSDYFILAILEKPSCIAYRILSKIMLYDKLQEAKDYYHDKLLNVTVSEHNLRKEFDTSFQKCISDSKVMAVKQKTKFINSGHLLYHILLYNGDTRDYFKNLGATANEISLQVKEETKFVSDDEKEKETLTKVTPVKHNKKPKKEEESTVDGNTSDIIRKTLSSTLSNVQGGECERSFTNLNEKAKKSQIEKICGCDDIYQEIFNVLSKRNKNNVAVVGKTGVGKTDIVRNIANLINEKKVPRQFAGKILFEIDINALFSGASMRGVFESRLKAIMNDARQKGNYIFFLDSMESAFRSKVNEGDAEELIENIIKEKNIMFICTCSEKGYATEIGDYPEWARYFEKINIEEPSIEKCTEILKHHAEKLEYFHNVKYDENCLVPCIKLCKRYITEKSLPDSAIDILDKTGAKQSLLEIENDNIRIARQKLFDIKQKRDELKASKNKKDYKEIDALEKEEIELRSILDYALKCYNLDRTPFVITEKNIRECVSQKTGIDLQELTTNDREKLKGINDRIKNVVIGQEEAIDEICQSIKRQRIGISNPNKPVVFLMAGPTGVGKSYLAKTIAKEVFGDEKKLVRLDMAEYADNTSITKLIGAGSGYIGYDNGGILTEAIKKNKHCVLLLDEIEKANEEVHNAFLSMFDEGRMTDNKGVTVDFKNIIVIMTSNVGAKQIEERGNGIGFVKDTNDLKKDIIKKELNKAFKPEFINRIDKIIYFNNLTEEKIRKIIALELTKLKKRIEDVGYVFEYEEEKTVDKIYVKVASQKNMGARPILREIQNEVEDKITNYLIENEIVEGNVINFNDI